MTPPAPPFVPLEPIDAQITLPPAGERERVVIDDQTARRARVMTLWMFDGRK